MPFRRVEEHGQGLVMLIDVGPWTIDSCTASDRLLVGERIAATPMRHRGVANGDRFVRLVCSNEPPRLAGLAHASGRRSGPKSGRPTASLAGGFQQDPEADDVVAVDVRAFDAEVARTSIGPFRNVPPRTTCPFVFSAGPSGPPRAIAGRSRPDTRRRRTRRRSRACRRAPCFGLEAPDRRREGEPVVPGQERDHLRVDAVPRHGGGVHCWARGQSRTGSPPPSGPRRRPLW